MTSLKTLHLRRFATWTAVALGTLAASGCAVVEVAGSAVGAAVSVTGSVVSSAVTVTGKAAGAAIDATTSSPKDK